MQLLIERGQRKTRILRRPIFNIWAKFDCTPEENFLIEKYKVANYILVLGKPGEFKKAAWITVGITLFIFLLFPALGLGVQNLGGIIALYGFCLFFVYHQIRELIKVDDILKGRFFKCKDIVTLITREMELAELGDCFRQLLEAMKNWGGREVIELRPYKAPPLRIGKLS